jgi:hypothetical protein
MIGFELPDAGGKTGNMGRSHGGTAQDGIGIIFESGFNVLAGCDQFNASATGGELGNRTISRERANGNDTGVLSRPINAIFIGTIIASGSYHQNIMLSSVFNSIIQECAVCLATQAKHNDIGTIVYGGGHGFGDIIG